MKALGKLLHALFFCIAVAPILLFGLAIGFIYEALSLGVYVGKEQFNDFMKRAE